MSETLSKSVLKRHAVQNDTITIDRAEYEAMKADAERLNTLMDMSGEYYQESIKHQFVGRLREFIDLHSTAVKQAIDQERKQSEG